MCLSARKWQNWPDPVWEPRRKHGKASTKIPWSDVRKSTANGGAARYHFDVDIRELELKCLAEGRNDPEKFELECDHEHICEFWMNAGYLVGASDGKDTQYVYVEWQVNGGQNGLHGYPITEAELRRMGARL